MKSIKPTQHAQKRMQQRAISALQVRLIRDFGRYEYQKGGANYAYVPDEALAELRHAIDKLSGVAVVFDESDKVITALRPERRIYRTKHVA